MSKKQKKAFVLRTNPELLAALEKWAADDFRSLNGQLEWIIHEALKKHKRLPRPKAEDEANPSQEKGTD